MTTTAINYAFMRLGRRAEGAEPAMLVDTFVDAGPLFTLLSSADHQILYGRRGTGKTHALQYLAQTAKTAGDVTVYIDVRTIGSNWSIYNAPNLPVVERGTRLLADVLAFVHDELVNAVLSRAEQPDFDYSLAMRLLDDLAEAITTVRVEGEIEQETRRLETSGAESSSGVEASLSDRPSMGIRATDSARSGRNQRSRSPSGGQGASTYTSAP